MERPHYTTAQIRELERLAIAVHGIPGFELMQRAGKAAFAALRQQWPAVRKLLVVCGTGNNGGDGCIVAGLARAAGLEVELRIVGERASIRDEALQALAYAEARFVVPGFVVAAPLFLPVEARPATVVVDALLGIGLRGEVRPLQRHVIDAINNSGLPVLAVDIPSGLCADTGTVLGACVKADLTVTFIGLKRGLVTGAAWCGKVVCDDLGIPAEIFRRMQAQPTRA